MSVDIAIGIGIAFGERRSSSKATFPHGEISSVDDPVLVEIRGQADSGTEFGDGMVVVTVVVNVARKGGCSVEKGSQLL